MEMSNGFVPTRAALLKSNPLNEFKVVTYESYKAKPKVQQLGSTNVLREEINKQVDKRKGIDIQRARREIIKFGISGFTHQKQQEAKVALAVSLGAKPPKKECKNYKEILERNKRQKRLDKKYEAMHLGKSSHSVGVSKQKIKFSNKTLKLAGGEKKKKKIDPLMMYGRPTLDTGSSVSTNKFHKKNSNRKRR